MNDLLIQKIDHYLKKHLDESRYTHTYGVAYTATALAMCHQEKIESAYIAGLLHDCAKCMTTEKKLKKCRKYQIEVTNVELENPFLLHGKVGAILAANKFEISDQDILNAISYHTTGRPEMSALEKIIYIADYIEPNRNPIPGLEEIRKMAFQDLDQTMSAILLHTLQYLKGKNAVIDPLSQLTYEYYKEKR